MAGLNDLIDFKNEPCGWEFEPCQERAAGLLDVGELNVYCEMHLQEWRAELDSQRERDMPKLPGLQEWYVRAARKAGVMR